LGLNSSEKLEKILKSSQSDGKTFSNILSNLDLLVKKEGVTINKEKYNKFSNFNNTHFKFKRTFAKNDENENENEPYYKLKKYSRELLKKNINTNEFREILLSNGINPNVEGINKFIRQHESGMNVKYHELLNAVIKNRDCNPTEINVKIKKKVMNTEADTTDSNIRCMIPMNNGTSQLNYVAKKKNIDINPNYQSNKDVFDWELCSLKKIKNGEFEVPERHRNEMTHKTIYESHVFDISPMNKNKNLAKEKPSKRILFLNGTGDILGWKGETKNNFNTTLNYHSKIKRTNPNQTKIQNEITIKPVKLNKMLQSSQENTLNTLN